MNIIDLRKNFRRSLMNSCIPAQGKSVSEMDLPEWSGGVTANTNTINRSQPERRKMDRRRNKESSVQLAEAGASKKTYTRILLTPAERRLIEDIYLSDLE
jgi:hypothetical protein